MLLVCYFNNFHHSLFNDAQDGLCAYMSLSCKYNYNY